MFSVDRPCESGDITFFYLSCDLVGLVSIGLMELEILAFVVSVPVPISMPSFHCRGLQMAIK